MRLAGWGAVKVGDKVTTKGRHSHEEPIVRGTLVHVGPHGNCMIRDAQGRMRQRGLANIRQDRELRGL